MCRYIVSSVLTFNPDPWSDDPIGCTRFHWIFTSTYRLLRCPFGEVGKQLIYSTLQITYPNLGKGKSSAQKCQLGWDMWSFPLSISILIQKVHWIIQWCVTQPAANSASISRNQPFFLRQPAFIGFWYCTEESRHAMRCLAEMVSKGPSDSRLRQKYSNIVTWGDISPPKKVKSYEELRNPSLSSHLWKKRYDSSQNWQHDLQVFQLGDFATTTASTVVWCENIQIFQSSS